MANAIFEQDEMQLILMVWGIPWESMTLGQANHLVVISSLIQNAVLGANRYLATLEHQRYIENTNILGTEAFSGLVKAFLSARRKGLTECTLLRVDTLGTDRRESGGLLASKLRQSDYIGLLEDGELYALLANTNRDDARYVIQRFMELGFGSRVVETMEDDGNDAA